MKKVIIFLTLLFLISSCRTEQVKLVKKESICNNDSFEYLICVQQQVQKSVDKNETPTQEGMDYILNSCCEYVNALDKSKKVISASNPKSNINNISNIK